MSLFSKATDLKASADGVKGQVEALKAQLAAKDAVISDLQSQLAEVPQVEALLVETKAELDALKA